MQRSDFEIMAPRAQPGGRPAGGRRQRLLRDPVRSTCERTRQGGFTIDDLNEIAALCREHGVKSYLTVNTVIYDGDAPPCAKSSRPRGRRASRPSSYSDVCGLRDAGSSASRCTSLRSSTSRMSSFALFTRSVCRRRRARARADAAAGGRHPRRDRPRGHHGPLGEVRAQ